jgi:voltage-gated potassium channel
MLRPVSGEGGSGRSLGYQMFILALSVLAIAMMAFVAVVKVSPSTHVIIDSADAVVCAVFLVDFAATLVASPNKVRYMATWGWLDLLSSLPAVDLARWGRAARMFRILRVLRTMRATRIMASLAIQHRARNAALAGVLLLILVVFSCSIAVLHFEDVEGGNIRTASDAMWWAATTVSTVGYGDFYPVTWEGRLIALVLMVTGVGSFGAIAAGLATWFMQPSNAEDHGEVGQLAREVKHLRELLESQSARSTAGKTTIGILAMSVLFATPGFAADKPAGLQPGQAFGGCCAGVHDGDSFTLLIKTPDGERPAKIGGDAID